MTNKEYRCAEIKKNCELIEMIQEHKHSEIVMDRLLDAVSQELEISIGDFLSAYAEDDADAMVTALTGWNLETLMAKARIIPDTKHYFYGEKEIPSAQIIFPLYGREDLTKEMFLAHLQKNGAISNDAMLLIQNALGYAREMFKNNEDRQNFLWSMLRNTVGIDEETVRKVVLSEEA